MISPVKTTLDYDLIRKYEFPEYTKAIDKLIALAFTSYHDEETETHFILKSAIEKRIKTFETQIRKTKAANSNEIKMMDCFADIMKTMQTDLLVVSTGYNPLLNSEIF